MTQKISSFTFKHINTTSKLSTSISSKNSYDTPISHHLHTPKRRSIKQIFSFPHAKVSKSFTIKPVYKETTEASSHNRKYLRITIHVLLFLIFSSLLPSPLSTTFADTTKPQLQVFIHKNTSTGSVWDDYNNQILVRLYKEENGTLKDIGLSQLYPYGASQRNKTNTPISSSGAFIGNNAVPSTANESFLSFDIPSAGSYIAKIDQLNGKIKKYINDNDKASVGFIDSYHCQENTKDAKQLQPQCQNSIMISPDDFAKADRRSKPFSIDLTVIPAQGSATIRPEEDTLTAGSNAEYDELVTFVGRFAIRVQTLLNWTLKVSQESFTNPTIERVYGKVLNIVNGFFIIILLVIAFMWNMSIIISRRYLRKVVILFMFAAVLVNFALPANRLFINITNILQNSFLVKDVMIQEGGKDKMIKSKITSDDILSIYDADYGAFVGLSKTDYIGKTYPKDGSPTSFPQGDAELKQTFSDKNDLYMERNAEPIYFNIALVILGTIAQLLITFILIFRIIILWFFLILSPFLFLLFLLKFLKQFFKYWIWLYFRWLFIGPLLAISLFIVVNIWSLTGVPIESTYAPPAALWFQNATNLYLAAPGVASGYLNTPREVMKYIASLIMLYMVVILPFWLTRRFEIFDWTEDKVSTFLKNKKLPFTFKPKTPDVPPITPPPPKDPLVLPTMKLDHDVEQDIDVHAFAQDFTTMTATVQGTVQEEGTVEAKGTATAEGNVQAQGKVQAEGTVDAVGKVEADVFVSEKKKESSKQAKLSKDKRMEGSVETQSTAQTSKTDQRFAQQQGSFQDAKTSTTSSSQKDAMIQNAQPASLEKATSNRSQEQEDEIQELTQEEEYALQEGQIRALNSGTQESQKMQEDTEDETEYVYTDTKQKTKQQKEFQADLDEEEKNEEQDKKERGKRLDQPLSSEEEERKTQKTERDLEENDSLSKQEKKGDKKEEDSLLDQEEKDEEEREKRLDQIISEEEQNRKAQREKRNEV